MEEENMEQQNGSMPAAEEAGEMSEDMEKKPEEGEMPEEGANQ